MGLSPINREAQMHRLYNQRRIALSLIQQSRSLLAPRTAFASQLNALIKKQGRFGSSDRRLYRELVYTYVRFKPWIEECGDNHEQLMDRVILLASPSKEMRTLYSTLGDRFDANERERWRYRLIGKSQADLKALLPDWFVSHIDSRLEPDEAACLFTRPPLWLRIQNGMMADHLEACNSVVRQGVGQCVAHPLVTDCIQAPSDLALANFEPYQSGAIEVQDISSQVLLNLIEPKPHGSWFDACAGAGGKTLQLAPMLGPEGRVTAYDPRQSALEELQNRVKRARLENVDVSQVPPEGSQFDGVLVDAPCSSSGTWRRHPFLMWQIDEDQVMGYPATQLELLKRYSHSVAPGGLLLYSTCSLSRYENEHVVDAFLAQGGGVFETLPLAERFGLKSNAQGITVFPWDLDGDGLFVAAMRRK